MKIYLSAVSIQEKEELSKMLQVYQEELFGKKDQGEYKYLDTYWGMNDRNAFFIKADDKIIGFVLVNKYKLLLKDGRSISEFYITKDFRKKGFGKQVALKIFEMFPENWEVREMEQNTSAQTFLKEFRGK